MARAQKGVGICVFFSLCARSLSSVLSWPSCSETASADVSCGAPRSMTSSQRSQTSSGSNWSWWEVREDGELTDVRVVETRGLHKHIQEMVGVAKKKT